MEIDISSRKKKHAKVLASVIFIALFFMILEVVFGVIANSLALLSDALHMFTDVGALGLSFIVVKIAQRPSTPSMSYGFERAEILGALCSSLSLWILSALLIYEAIFRLISPQDVKGPIVFVVATLGLLANILMMHMLKPRKDENINIAAAYLHVLGDLLASIGVIISGLLLWITKWNIIDPLITIFFVIIILFQSTKIIRQSVSILMEAAPRGTDPTKIKEDLMKIPGVEDVHDLHIWSVTPQNIALSTHLVAKDEKKTLNEAHRLLETNHHIRHMTIQVEAPGEFESRFCFECEKHTKS